MRRAILDVGIFALVMLMLSEAHSASVSSFGVMLTVVGPRAPATRFLDASDNGKTLFLRVGDSLKLDLPVPAQFGGAYTWRVESKNLLSAQRVSTVASANNLDAVEIQRFEFNAVSAGTAVLRLEYRQPWTNALYQDAVQSFTARLRIQGP
jgi:predicted secreted protein